MSRQALDVIVFTISMTLMFLLPVVLFVLTIESILS